jgi:hypothetical protein
MRPAGQRNRIHDHRRCVLLVAVVAHGAAIMAALLKLVAWSTTKIAVLEGRIGTLERAVDNDITGRRVVAQIVNDVAVIKPG